MSATFYSKALRLTDAAPETVGAAYRWGCLHAKQLAAQAVTHPNAGSDILDDAQASKIAEVRVAWLTRPGRTKEEQTAALQREGRGEVLASLVTHLADDPDLLGELAAMRKRPVALEIARHNPTLPAGSPVVRDVLYTLLPAYGAFSGRRQQVIKQFAAGHMDEFLAQITSVTDLDLLAVALTHNPALPSHVCEHIAGRLTATTQMQTYRTRRYSIALLNQQNLPVELIEPLARPFALDRMVTDAANAARATNRDPDQAAEMLKKAATTDNPNELQQLWDDPTLRPLRDTLAPVLVANPATPAHLFPDMVQLRGRIDETLATTIRDTHGDDILATVLACHGGDPALLSAAADPETARLTYVATSLTRSPANAGALINSGVLRPGDVPGLSWKALHGTNDARLMRWTQSNLAAAFGNNQSAWQLFENFNDRFTGTLDELIGLCRGATTA